MLEDQVVLGLVHAVIALRLQLGGGGLAVGAGGDPQQDQHRDSRDEQHVGFAQGVEGTVVQDHTGDDVDCAGLLHALFDVAGGDLVVGGIVGGAVGRELRCGGDQQHDDAHADDHGGNAIHPGGNALALIGGPGMHMGVHILLGLGPGSAASV